MYNQSISLSLYIYICIRAAPGESAPLRGTRLPGPASEGGFAVVYLVCVYIYIYIYIYNENIYISISMCLYKHINLYSIVFNYVCPQSVPSLSPHCTMRDPIYPLRPVTTRTSLRRRPISMIIIELAPKPLQLSIIIIELAPKPLHLSIIIIEWPPSDRPPKDSPGIMNQ